MPLRDLRVDASLWDDGFSMFKMKNAFGWHTTTAFVWAFVALSGWYWTQAVIAASKPPQSEVRRTASVSDVSNPVVLSRLLGATPAAMAGPGPGPVDRFVLSGVIASNVGQGAALIAVDGKPARPFAVGAELAPGYVLVSVASREAMLAEGLNAPVRAVLTLPLLRSAEVSAAPPSAASSVATPPAAAPSASISGASSAPSITPGAAEPLPQVPARADARRQPQTSLRREDRRTP